MSFQPMSSGYGPASRSLTKRADGLLGALTIQQAPARARPGSAARAPQRCAPATTTPEAAATDAIIASSRSFLEGRTRLPNGASGVVVPSVAHVPLAGPVPPP